LGCERLELFGLRDVLRDRQVVNVDFQTLLFEFLENVRSQSPDHAIISQGHKNDEALVRDKRPKILLARYRALIRVRVLEGFGKNSKQLFQRRLILRSAWSA
jgi:hypothetical protein